MFTIIYLVCFSVTECQPDAGEVVIPSIELCEQFAQGTVDLMKNMMETGQLRKGDIYYQCIDWSGKIG